MSETDVLSVIPQCVIINFLSNERVKATNILRQLRTRLGNETLLWAKVFK